MPSSSQQLPYRTLEEAVEIARGLAPKLRERVAQAEEVRRLPEENVRDLIDSGLIALEVPKRFGGAELNLDALIEVTGAIAEGCPATGWVYSLWARAYVADRPVPGARPGDGVRGPQLARLVGREHRWDARGVDGGFRWTGRGFFSSGVDHCNWLTAAVELEPQRTAGRSALVAIEALRLRDRGRLAHGGPASGTGSKTITIDDAFIPDERVVFQKDLRGQGDWAPPVRLAVVLRGDGFHVQPALAARWSASRAQQ